MMQYSIKPGPIWYWVAVERFCSCLIVHNGERRGGRRAGRREHSKVSTRYLRFQMAICCSLPALESCALGCCCMWVCNMLRRAALRGPKAVPPLRPAVDAVTRVIDSSCTFLEQRLLIGFELSPCRGNGDYWSVVLSFNSRTRFAWTCGSFRVVKNKSTCISRLIMTLKSLPSSLWPRPQCSHGSHPLLAGCRFSLVWISRDDKSQLVVFLVVILILVLVFVV